MKSPRLIEKYKGLLPFVALAWSNLDKQCSSILDVGCGFGEPMAEARAPNKNGRFYSVGLDRFLPAIKACKRTDKHTAYVLCDARFLPIKQKAVDAILCFEVIEHLNKSDGFNLVREFDRIARCQIILSTPVGFLPLVLGHKENQSDIHLCGWFPSEFRKLGYCVRGINGLKCVSGAHNGGVGTKVLGDTAKSKISRYLIYLVSYLSRPMAYLFPNQAFRMLCVRKKQVDL